MMNTREMSLGFHDASTQSVLIAPIKIAPNIAKHSSFKQYIYSWMALEELIKVMKRQPRDDFDLENDRLERFSVRFVVDTNYNSWFALEGELSTVTPVHSQMVNEAHVVTAGNIVFSEDYKTIIEITNKSGHYLPEFKTLVFFIQMLFALETDPRFSIKIAPEIKLVSYARQSSFIPDPISHIILEKEELRSLLPEDIAPPLRPYPFAKLRRTEAEQLVFNSPEDYFNHIVPPKTERKSFPDLRLRYDTVNSFQAQSRKSLSISTTLADSSQQLSDFGVFRSGKRSNEDSHHSVNQIICDSMVSSSQTKGIAPISSSPPKKARPFSEQETKENTIAYGIAELVK